jgi:hypothetical protein
MGRHITLARGLNKRRLKTHLEAHQDYSGVMLEAPVGYINTEMSDWDGAWLSHEVGRVPWTYDSISGRYTPSIRS